MMIYKYNGCGNDFILLDYDGVTDYSQLAIQLCGKENFDTDGLIAVKTVVRLCVGMVSVASRVMFATKVSFKHHSSMYTH